MRQWRACPPHEYRASGRPFRSVIGSKKVKRRDWTGKKTIVRIVKEDVRGPMEQWWFCARCGHETKSAAGPKRP